MPITIPTFNQYQQPMFPLRGLWNNPPPEGDYFVNAELDWGTSGTGTAVQFALSGNSPVALSQIVALMVDNSRCGVDVDFLFPDSGFVLTVPAYNQGLYPVLSNALMFYAVATGANAGSVTILQILNSYPPPIAIQPSSEQQNVGVTGVSGANGTTALVPAGINGTLLGFSISVNYLTGATGAGVLYIQDGTTRQLWQESLSAAPVSNQVQNLSGLRIRFTNGLNLVVSGSTLTATTINANVYYSVP